MTHAPATPKVNGKGDAVALPDGWRTAAIGDVCVDQTESRDPRRDPEAPFRYVDIFSVDNQRKVIREARQLLGKEASSRARKVIRTNDVLVVTTRPNLNAVALVTPDLDNEICSTGFCVLRPKPEIDPDYLFAFVQTTAFVLTLSDLVKGALYPAVTDGQVRAERLPLPPLRLKQNVDSLLVAQQMMTRALRDQIQLVAKRAIGQASINSEALRSLQVILPPLVEQRLYSAAIQKEYAAAESLAAALAARLTALDHLPAALLREAFAGRI